VRALVVSNMLPDAAHPERGTFVRDQVADLRRVGGVEVELYEFPPGPRALAAAAIDLRRRFGGPSTLSRRPARVPFDIVHAHYGLTAWPAFAVPARVHALTVHGHDMRHPRTRIITWAALGRIDLLAAV
jgi:teichuronic acid biosynthesis glycosyltransferase TuaC